MTIVEHGKKEAEDKARLLGKDKNWEDGFLSGWMVLYNHDSLVRVIKSNPDFYSDSKNLKV